MFKNRTSLILVFLLALTMSIVEPQELFVDDTTNFVNNLSSKSHSEAKHFTTSEDNSEHGKAKYDKAITKVSYTLDG